MAIDFGRTFSGEEDRSGPRNSRSCPLSEEHDRRPSARAFSVNASKEFLKRRCLPEAYAATLGRSDWLHL